MTGQISRINLTLASFRYFVTAYLEYVIGDDGILLVSHERCVDNQGTVV